MDERHTLADTRDIGEHCISAEAEKYPVNGWEKSYGWISTDPAIRVFKEKDKVSSTFN
jgi:hypothetical protein